MTPVAGYQNGLSSSGHFQKREVAWIGKPGRERKGRDWLAEKPNSPEDLLSVLGANSQFRPM